MSQIKVGVFFGPPGFCTRPQKCSWPALRLAQEQSVSPRDDIILALETLRGKRNRLKNFIQKSFKWGEGASSCYCVEPANSGAYEKNSQGTGVLQSWYRSWEAGVPSFLWKGGWVGESLFWIILQKWSKSSSCCEILVAFPLLIERGWKRSYWTGSGW